MTRIVLQSKTGPDGTLHLEVPLGTPDTSYEIDVIVRPKASARPFSHSYFDAIGSVDDETFIFHPHPTSPPPLDFD